MALSRHERLSGPRSGCVGSFGLALIGAVLGLSSVLAHAGDDECRGEGPPAIEFVEFKSPNLAAPPGTLLTIKGKLTVPERDCSRGHKLPAVLILHGSSGVDSRGDFYEAELNDAGIATL